MLVSPRPATSQLLSLERPTRRFSNRPGVLPARQFERGESIRNDRLIGVGETPVNLSPVRGLRDLEAGQVSDIARFSADKHAAGRLGCAHSRWRFSL